MPKPDLIATLRYPAKFAPFDLQRYCIVPLAIFHAKIPVRSLSKPLALTIKQIPVQQQMLTLVQHFEFEKYRQSNGSYQLPKSLTPQRVYDTYLTAHRLKIDLKLIEACVKWLCTNRTYLEKLLREKPSFKPPGGTKQIRIHKKYGAKFSQFFLEDKSTTTLGASPWTQYTTLHVDCKNITADDQLCLFNEVLPKCNRLEKLTLSHVNIHRLQNVKIKLPTLKNLTIQQTRFPERHSPLVQSFLNAIASKLTLDNCNLPKSLINALIKQRLPHLKLSDSKNSLTHILDRIAIATNEYTKCHLQWRQNFHVDSIFFYLTYDYLYKLPEYLTKYRKEGQGPAVAFLKWFTSQKNNPLTKYFLAKIKTHVSKNPQLKWLIAAGATEYRRTK